MVGSFLSRHDRRPIEIAVGDARENRGVGDAQPFDANDATFRIDHAHPVVRSSHLAGPAWVIGAFHMLADKCIEIVVRLNMASWRDFAAAVGCESILAENLARQADAMAEVRPVVLM